MKRIFSLFLVILTALTLLSSCKQEAVDFILDTAIDMLEETSTSPTESAPPENTPAETTPQETAPTQDSQKPDKPQSPQLAEDGSYTNKEDVALYLHLYGKLPKNFITKKEAQNLGWSGGNLEPYAPGKCIGGDRFGNYEGLLPEKKGRSYQECDIDTLGAKERGAKRIVFSNDGLIYYTPDHYKSFELLYGEE